LNESALRRASSPADDADAEEVEQRLIEGLHAQVAGAGHDVLDLVQAAFHDQVADQGANSA
jgi:DNA-binding GntR family transcriptional regulator